MAADQPVNILLVDDRTENLVALESVLCDLGQNLVMARSGAEALRCLLDREFAVILLDVQMPGMDGFETAEMIRSRERSRDIPIIFLTAINKADTHVSRGYSVGAVDYLFKPFTPEVLKGKVTAFVELSRKTAELKAEIEQRRQAEKLLDASNSLLEVISQTLVSFISGRDLSVTLASLLHSILAMTDSAYGFIGETLSDADGDPYLKTFAILGRSSGRAGLSPANGCSEAPPEHRNLKALCRSLQERLAPLIANGPETIPPSDHLPAGHPPLRSFLAMPLYRGSSQVGVVALGNRAEGYDPGIAAHMEPFLHTCAVLIDANRSEERRQQAEEQVRRLNEDLERRVAERTAALETANRELENEIAERKRVEEERARLLHELQEAARHKDEFLAMLAHELRNPLAAISGAEYVMEEWGAEDPRVARLQPIIGRQTRHLSRMVDDLLDLSRIDRGKIELKKEPVSLPVVVQRAIESTASLFEARGHELTAALPAENVWLDADPTRLEQVMWNLLNNAAKYTDPGGRISLVAEREGDDVVVKVQDNGIGIASELLPRIFDLFTQAERSLDRSLGGLGIGLALVRTIVQMHGGSIAACSDGPGCGSLFVLRLPVLPREYVPEIHPATQHPSHPDRTLRILLVDDSQDAAEPLAEILELWGHQVQVCHDGATALAQVHQCSPQVVLLDIGLPGIDGYEVARRIRQQYGPDSIYLIALTGYGREDDRRRADEAGFNLHLTKPADPAALMQLLGEISI